MDIIKLNEEHIKAIHSIEESCFASPWNENTILSLIESDNAQCFGCFEEDTLVGYVALEWVLDEGSLTNLAVIPSCRRRGIAQELVEILLEESKSLKLQFVTLEVRVTNTPASNLYRKMGFEEVGVRRGYYSNPREDARLMTKYL